MNGSSSGSSAALLFILAMLLMVLWPVLKEPFDTEFHETILRELAQYRSQLSATCVSVGEYLEQPPDSIRRPGEYRGLLKDKQYRAMLRKTLDSLPTVDGEAASIRVDSTRSYHAYRVWREQCVTEQMKTALESTV